MTHIETLLRHIQAYSAPFVTLAYSQPCHILNPGIFRTGGLLKALWDVDQTYSEPCHRASFSHIQAYSESCATLAYAETRHIQNPGIFGTRPWLYPDIYSEPCHIYENLRIFRNLTCLKPDTYAEPSQRFKMEFFAKKCKNCNYFSKALHLRSLTEFWIRNLSVSAH